MKRFDSTTYSKVPLYIAMIPLSTWALRVYIVLRRYINNTTRAAFPSRQTLADYFPAPDAFRQVKRGLRELAAVGIIKKEPRESPDEGSKTNLYKLVSDADCKKIYERFLMETCARGGDKFAPRGGDKFAPPLKELLNVKEKENEDIGIRPTPTRVHTSGKNPETQKILEHMAETYQKIKGQPMRLAPRHLKIVQNLARIYGEGGVRALWSTWWRSGSWARFAHASGHSVEAWDRCIDQLVDAPEYRDYLAAERGREDTPGEKIMRMVAAIDG